jgi:chorismate mutase
MNFEQLKVAKSLEVCINAANKNIEHLEQLKACDEIMIVANTSKAYEAIKGIYYDREMGNLPPVYYSGKVKDEMIDVAIKKNEESRNKNLRALSEI